MSDEREFDWPTDPLNLIREPGFYVSNPMHLTTQRQQQLDAYRPQYGLTTQSPRAHHSQKVVDCELTVILESGEIVSWPDAEIGVPENEQNVEHLHLYGFRRDVLAVLDHSTGIVSLRVPGATSLACFSMSRQSRSELSDPHPSATPESSNSPQDSGLDTREEASEFEGVPSREAETPPRLPPDPIALTGEPLRRRRWR